MPSFRAPRPTASSPAPLFALAIGAATLACAPAAHADRLVQTRLTPSIQLEAGPNSISIDPAAYFMRFDDAGPLVEFTIQLPVQAARGVVPLKYDGAGSFEMMTYTTISGIDYTDAVSVNGNQLLRREERIRVQLFPESAPITVSNFLSYTTDGAYDRTIIHRSVPSLNIIQGGSFWFNNRTLDYISVDRPIILENNLPLTPGTLAMARGDSTDSATSGWFFNLEDNTETWPSPSYAVFGQTDAAGIQIIREIGEVSTWDLFPDNPLDAFNNIPIYVFGSELVDGKYSFPPSNYVIFDHIRLIDGTREGVSYAVRVSDHAAAGTSVSNEGGIEHIEFAAAAPGSFARATVQASYAGETRSAEIRLEYPHPGVATQLGARLERPMWYEGGSAGPFHAGAFPWLHRAQHGWQMFHVDADAAPGTAWLFDPRLGWLHLRTATAPVVFIAAHSLWAVFDADATAPARRLYVFPGQPGAYSGWVDEAALAQP